MSKILQYVEIGKQEGAQLVSGGSRVGSEGFFVKPTVFANVTDQMTIAQEEVRTIHLIYYMLFKRKEGIDVYASF